MFLAIVLDASRASLVNWTPSLPPPRFCVPEFRRLRRAVSRERDVSVSSLRHFVTSPPSCLPGACPRASLPSSLNLLQHLRPRLQHGVDAVDGFVVGIDGLGIDEAAHAGEEFGIFRDALGDDFGHFHAAGEDGAVAAADLAADVEDDRAGAVNLGLHAAGGSSIVAAGEVKWPTVHRPQTTSPHPRYDPTLMTRTADTMTTEPPTAPPIGLIAGGGRLPILVAGGIRAAGRRVVCIGLREQFDDDLPGECDAFAVAGIVQLGKWIRLLKRFGAEEAIMVGRVAKTRMHDPLKLIRQLPDLRAIRLWYRTLRHDRRNRALLAAVADELLVNGVMLIDSTRYIPEHLAEEGLMTPGLKLSEAARADIAFGWPLLERVVELDIGQSIAVRDRDVLCVEAVEGTDRMIERAGELCKAKGWTLLKTASVLHDRRADVPTIGVQTVERVAALGGRCIALGAGRVIVIERPKVIELAERLKVVIVGIGPAGDPGKGHGPVDPKGRAEGD